MIGQCSVLLGCVLAVTSLAAPQPAHSMGLIVIYGNTNLVRANAEYRGYSLKGYAFGLSAISPAMLGKVAWVRVPGGRWLGPGLIVDAVGRNDAFDSIFGRHEIGEVSRATAHALGFDNGGRWGEIYFGQCPPSSVAGAQPYAPARETWRWPWAPEPYHAYPPQQLPIDCSAARQQ